MEEKKELGLNILTTEEFWEIGEDGSISGAPDGVFVWTNGVDNEIVRIERIEDGKFKCRFFREIFWKSEEPNFGRMYYVETDPGRVSQATYQISTVISVFTKMIFGHFLEYERVGGIKL